MIFFFIFLVLEPVTGTNCEDEGFLSDPSKKYCAKNMIFDVGSSTWYQAKIGKKIIKLFSEDSG